MLLDYSSNVDTSLPLGPLFDCKQDTSQPTYKKCVYLLQTQYNVLK